MTPRTSPIPAASTFFYGPPDRRRRRAGRRQSKHPSPPPERPQPAQAWKASAVRGTSYASSVEVGIPSTEPPSYRGHVRSKPILLALIFSAFFVLNLTGASSAPPTLVAPVLSASVTGTEVSLTWTDAGGENSYYVMRLPPAAVTWTQIAQLHANTLQYKDSGLSRSTTYHYVVVATRGWKQMNANAVQVTTGVTPSLALSPSPSPLPSLAASPSPNPSPSPSPSSYPSPSPSPSPRPSSSPSPVPVCDGVQVAAGADLRATMAAVTTPATFCLAAGLYEIGDTPIVPQAGDAVVGVPVTVGPNGEIDAPTKIHGTSANGIFRSPSNSAAFRAENVDVSGSTTTCFHHNSAFTLTLRYARVHDCLESGVGAHGYSLFEHVEIDHNGSPGFLENSGGGMKFAFSTNITVRFAYVHDNIGDGVWWDCDEHAGTIEDSLIVRNSLSGIFIEISSGDGGGFIVQRNIVQNNNTSGAAIHAGILVVDSQNVTVTGNTLGGNGRGINVFNDSRSTRGHNGCSSGFPSANISVTNNVLADDLLLFG